jgi:murein DD-endopeptidase MepM/ murein hydrolase activator NlpD
MRSGPDGFNTREAALAASAAPPPQGDANGLITYAGYQAVRANGRESVQDVAQRLGVDGNELARFNALNATDSPSAGEILVLPTRLNGAASDSSRTGTGTGTGKGQDLSDFASTVLDRVSTTALPVATVQDQTQTQAAGAPMGEASGAQPEPARHKVQRGETAFGIARQYNVSTKALAQWNGLGPDFSVREGQYLIIPVTGQMPPPNAQSERASVSEPGAGSSTPLPPSALTPLPNEETTPPAASKLLVVKPVADLSNTVTAASSAALAMPVSGKIIRGYAKGKNDGIDIAAPAGTPVKSAAAGVVAAITKSTAGTPIVLIRHSGGLLTVYGGVDGLTVAKGDKVARGQTIAGIGQGATSFLHFEVRRGVESVDPMGYLQ